MLAGPILFFSVVTGCRYLHGQVLDSGDYKYDTVAVTYSDGIKPDGTVTYPVFYGAHIYTVARSTGYDVYCEVHLGGDFYNHTCGHLGRVKSTREARQLWGSIKWTATELIVGDPSGRGIRVPRSEIQGHR
jgi:hypothetical protein